MANNFKNVIDRQKWVQVAPAPIAHTGAGYSYAADLRNDISRNPFVYNLATGYVLSRYNIIQKSWEGIQAMGLGGTFSSGAGCIFAPSRGLTGTVSTGSTTLVVTNSTTITAVGVNMLANRGGGNYGFRIRIIGNGSGGSGKIEERWITGSTGGTTPSFALDTALSFTPVTGDTWEILAGRVFTLGGGTLAANSFKSFEVATNTLSGNLGTTNLPATISTDFSAVTLDEQYTPTTRKPSEGFIVGAGTYNGTALNCLIATGIAAGTITGQASAGDAGVLANEYRNFQIRIVEDTTNTTAVGQRRIIASHTAGVSPVYTLGANWTVTPSATAKFVIEYPNLLLLWSSATAVTYTYNYSGASITNGTNTIANDAWHVTYFGNRGASMAAGSVSFTSHGITPDVDKNARHSHIHSFRGGSATLDVLDIAGASNGSWSNAAVYDGGNTKTFGNGTCGAAAPFADDGRFAYINIYTANQVSQIFRYDVKNRVLATHVATDWIQTGTAATGGRMASYVAIDGTDKYAVVLLTAHISAISQELIIQT